MSRSKLRWSKGNKLYYGNKLLWGISKKEKEYFVEYPNGDLGTQSLGENYLDALKTAETLANQAFDS